MNRVVTPILTLALLLLALAPAEAQSEKRKRRDREKKLAMDWVTLSEWNFDYEEALEIAAEEKKIILAYFTESARPNGGCLDVENGTLTDPGFVALSEKLVLFAHLDSGLEGEPHPELLQEKGGTKPPYLIFLDAAGAVIGEPFGASVAAIRDALPFAQRYAQLAGQAKTREEQVELLVAELRLGRIKTVDAAEKRKADISGRTAAETLAIDSAIVDLRIADLMREKRVQNEAEAAALGKRFYEWHEKGLRPAREKPSVGFWNMIRIYGKLEKKPDIYEIGYEGMKSWYATQGRAAGALRQMADELKSLREGN